MTSILTDVKKTMGIDESYTAFDPDIIMHINSVLAILDQLGVGPEGGMAIQDKTATWYDLYGDDPRLNNIKTYIYMRVRMLFDPPTTGYLVQSMQEQIKEMEWRINIVREWDTSQPVVEDPAPTVVEQLVAPVPTAGSVRIHRTPLGRTRE